MALRRAQPKQEESALVRAERSREYAALAAGAPEQKAEWFAAEQPGPAALVLLAISRQRAKRAFAQQARVAPAAFARARPWERLVQEVARSEMALAACVVVAEAQVPSPKWKTASAWAVLRKSALPLVSRGRVFLLPEAPRERRVAGQIHRQLAQPHAQRTRVGA